MLSKERIDPIWPKDFSTRIREGRAAPNAAFEPGTVVVRQDGLIVRCTTGTSSHIFLPSEVVWTDGSTRLDSRERYELDGTIRSEHTTICGDFIADVAPVCFTVTPEPGDVMMKSATPGKIDPLNSAELAVLADNVEETIIFRSIGVVVGPGERPGFYRCHFRQ